MRPTCEYGLSLGIHTQSQLSKPVSSELQQLHVEAVNWIIRGNSRLVKVKQSLLGLGSSLSRVTDLNGGMIRHLDTMANSNPLANLYMAIDRDPLQQRRRLIKALRHDPTYSTWQRENEQKSPQEQVTWKTYTRKKALEDSMGTKLVCYIAHKSRQHGSLIDKTILLRDNAVRSQSITWRLNKLSGLRCLVCNKTLTRRHAISCLPLDQLPPHLRPSFDRDKAALDRRFPRLDLLFTPLDFLLNNSLYDEFTNALQRLVALHS